MRKFLLCITAGLLMQPATAQRVCGSMDHLHQLEIANPEVIQNRIAIEEQIQHFIDNAEFEDGRLLVTIPVVVHVVYNTTAQNISDAQIQSQMTVLNNDFRKLNADVGGVPSLFSSLAADCEINFCLAQRDPNGAASTGIERRQTSVTSFSTNDAVKYYSSGGLNAWPATSYLNIWVCNLSGGVLGYAQFPGGPAATDGVVCTYTAFGTTGTATALFHLGRTATHEVGHWLNLYHIWGDDGNQCTGSDLVSDTPNQADENYGCPSFPTPSCSNTSDMYMNYMDYTNDACMFMFTTGQKNRMQALFGTGGARVSLLSSQGCVPPGGGSCGTPSGLTASSVTSNSATLSWTAVSGATSYTVGLKTASAQTYTNYSATGTTISFTGLAASTTYNWQVTAVCGSNTGTVAQGPNFTTSSGSACTDAYESNNVKGSAKLIPKNTDITALISSSTDIDWFKFSTTKPNTKVKITLSNLPADYDVVLYKGSTQVGIGQNGGTANEVITYNTTTTGTYYIKVYGYNGAFNATNCYTLNASVSSTNWRLAADGLEQEELPEATTIQATVYPNPSSGLVHFKLATSGKLESLNISVMDLSGSVVSYSELEPLAGTVEHTVDLGQLPSGIYIAAIRAGETVETKKLVITR